ncbi:GGDEF domain-containing protein [Pseudonocardia spinosispora]|uniref:GGDEF domain-containing protein n=1 Tax=Pseudonocardia spinosispora TaxID=103441 RepID=UPI000685B097|nr:GGDEF domain-containing protein [Pseudonocardia spinosispora]
MSSSQRGRTAERPSHRADSAVGRVPAARPESSLNTHLELDSHLDLTAVQECIADGEELARLGLWEEAYRRMANAVELLHDAPDRPHPVRAELDRLRHEHEMVREQARRDFLTASYNRRYLDDRLSTLLNDPAVVRSGMALAMVDIDHFKKVNDRYGHPFGDRVLQHVVAQLDAALPDGAFCARYGGEEFALVMPGFEPSEAVEVCEVARTRIDTHRWLELDPDLRVTVSVGVAHSVAEPPDVEQLLVGADVLLYAAKGAGRNAVAYRKHDGAVALAGAAGARRDIPQPASMRG